MAAPRHKHVADRPASRRLPRLALPAGAAALLTTTVVGVALASTAATTSAAGDGSGTGSDSGAASDSSTITLAADLGAKAFVVDTGKAAQIDPFDTTARKLDFSRSAPRVTLEEKPVAEDRMWMTEDLNVRPEPAEDAKVLEVLEVGTRVGVTGVEKNGFAEIVQDGVSRWVSAEYLVAKKPDEDVVTVGGLSTAPCAAGSSIESGLTSSAVTVYRAVCAEFPQITSYGGYDAHGEHSTGRAIDIMVTDSAVGQQIANFLQANAAELNLYDVIWAQHIYTQERGSEGWRYMSDRGSATANHYDHVHVATY